MSNALIMMLVIMGGTILLRAPISFGDRSSTGTSNARAIAAVRFSSSARSRVSATEIEPTCRNPVATPVSPSRLP